MLPGKLEFDRTREPAHDADGLDSPLLGQFCRWVEASLAAGMNSLPVIDEKLRPNGSYPYQRIHTPDPEPLLPTE